MSDYLPDFFTLQSHQLRGATRWTVPGYGEECFAEMRKAAGSRDSLARMAQSGEWADDVLHAFCMNNGMSRDIYHPLDPFGRNPPRVWKTRWAAEFVDWFLKKFPEPEASEEADKVVEEEEKPKAKAKGKKNGAQTQQVVA